MAIDTTPIPIADIILLHDYNKDPCLPCPGCDWEKYLAVRVRLGSEKAEEFVSHEYEPDTKAY